MKNFCILISVIISVLIVAQTFCIVFVAKEFINSDHNRYEIYMHPTYRADQYLIDHKTGRVWQCVVDKNGTTLWQYMKGTPFKSKINWEKYGAKPSVYNQQVKDDFWEDDVIELNKSLGVN